MMSEFEFIGRQVAEGRMPPLAIVEQFDVFEDFASCLGSGVPVALITQFEFECGEKTLGQRRIRRCVIVLSRTCSIREKHALDFGK